jgi:two-component system, OmpR family, response regulator
MQVVSRASMRKTGSIVLDPLRVFVVEDSKVIREHLIETISSLPNVKVVGYADAEAEAISALQRTPCDVVVLDLQLREGHGFKVLDSLRAPADRPHMTIIVLSNFNSAPYRRRSIEMGADYFFDKSREYHCVGDVLNDLACRRKRNLA